MEGSGGREGNDDEATAAAERTRPGAPPRVEREREGASAALARGIGAAAGARVDSEDGSEDMDMDMDDDKDDSNAAAKTQWGNIFSGAKKALDEMTRAKLKIDKAGQAALLKLLTQAKKGGGAGAKITDSKFDTIIISFSHTSPYNHKTLVICMDCKFHYYLSKNLQSEAHH